MADKKRNTKKKANEEQEPAPIAVEATSTATSKQDVLLEKKSDSLEAKSPKTTRGRPKKKNEVETKITQTDLDSVEPEVQKSVEEAEPAESKTKKILEAKKRLMLLHRLWKK